MSVTAAGEVVRKNVGAGTKSEHTAVVLVADGHEYVLRRAGGNAFRDPTVDALVGKKIHASGTVAGVNFIMEEWTEE